MPMTFSYIALPTKQPIPSLGGGMTRYRPIAAVRLIGPLGSRLLDGCVDSACDDTIFPKWVAVSLGIDLTNAVQGEARTGGGVIVPYHYARVTLRVTDGKEECEWKAIVGFTDLPLHWGLLGHAGFLDFFDSELRGARRELVLTPNTSFPGQHIVHQLP